MKKYFKDSGVKYAGLLLVVIGFSALGILVYLFKAIVSIPSAKLGTLFFIYFPVIMFVLMYISMIRYTIDYFIKGLEESISGMLMRYCALTAATTIFTGDKLTYLLVVCNTIVLVLVPMVRDALGKDRKIVVISLIILVLVYVVASDNILSGRLDAAIAGYANPNAIDCFVEVLNCFNPALQWTLFMILMLARFLQDPKKYYQKKDKKSKKEKKEKCPKGTRGARGAKFPKGSNEGCRVYV